MITDAAVISHRYISRIIITCYLVHNRTAVKANGRRRQDGIALFRKCYNKVRCPLQYRMEILA